MNDLFPTPPSPRLAQMRQRSALCIENESSWHAMHKWQMRGRDMYCLRCTLLLSEVLANEEAMERKSL